MLHQKPTLIGAMTVFWTICLTTHSRHHHAHGPIQKDQTMASLLCIAYLVDLWDIFCNRQVSQCTPLALPRNPHVSAFFDEGQANDCVANRVNFALACSFSELSKDGRRLTTWVSGFKKDNVTISMTAMLDLLHNSYFLGLKLL